MTAQVRLTRRVKRNKSSTIIILRPLSLVMTLQLRYTAVPWWETVDPPNARWWYSSETAFPTPNIDQVDTAAQRNSTATRWYGVVLTCRGEGHTAQAVECTPPIEAMDRCEDGRNVAGDKRKLGADLPLLHREMGDGEIDIMRHVQ